MVLEKPEKSGLPEAIISHLGGIMPDYSRVKTKTYPQTGGYYYQSQFGTQINYSFTAGGETRLTGWVSTDWKKQLGTQGFIKTKPLQIRRYAQRPSGEVPTKGTRAGVVTFSNGAFVSTPYTIGQAGVSPVVGATDASLNSVLNKAVADANRKLRRVNVNMVVAAVEGPKTLKMFASTANRIGHAYSYLRKGNFRAAARELACEPLPVSQQWRYLPEGRSKGTWKGKVTTSRKTALTNNWLEMRYGWTPLLYDLDGAVRLLAEEIVGRRPRLHIIGKAMESEVLTEYRTDYNALRAHGWFSVQHKVTLHRERSAKVTYLVEVVNQGLQTQQGLGLLNPFLIAWELVPYSFVVDWFVNVGDVLTNLNTVDNFNLLDASFGRKVVETYTFDVNSVWGTQAVVASWTKPAPFNSVLESYDRYRSTLIPSVKFEVSGLDKLRQVVDGVALLKQRFYR